MPVCFKKRIFQTNALAVKFFRELRVSNLMEKQQRREKQDAEAVLQIKIDDEGENQRGENL